MRVPFAALAVASASLAAVTLALSLPVAAQDPGCLQSNPCDLAVDVDASGIDTDRATFTAGDWVRLSVYNDDDVPHTVRLAGHDITLVVPAYDIVESAPFELGRAGTYQLSDSPTGDTADVVVQAAETFSQPQTSGDKGAPGPGLAMLALALVGLAILRRR